MLIAALGLAFFAGVVGFFAAAAVVVRRQRMDKLEETEAKVKDGINMLSVAAATTVRHVRETGANVLLISFDDAVVMVGVHPEICDDIREFYAWRAENNKPAAEA
jgi:hypothetical protein